MTLLQLPDELLLEIFKPLFSPAPAPAITAWASDPETRGWHAPDAAALPKVSRRFYRLATPGLYTHLTINFDAFPTNAARLYRTLSENPELRTYCRSLRIVLPDTRHYVPVPGDPLAARLQAGYDVQTEIVSWLTNVKDLSVTGHFHSPRLEKATWDLVLAAGQHMPKLEKLSLGVQVGLERLCEVLGEIKQLRTLEIGIGVVMGASGFGVDFTYVMPSPRAEQVGSSAVTSISMDCLLAATSNLDRLLLVPARLEHFAFKGMAPRSYFSGRLSHMISALEPHKATLQTLHVASGRASGFDDLETHLEDEVKDLDLGGFTELKGITFIAAPA